MVAGAGCGRSALGFATDSPDRDNLFISSHERRHSGRPAPAPAPAPACAAAGRQTIINARPTKVKAFFPRRRSRPPRVTDAASRFVTAASVCRFRHRSGRGAITSHLTAEAGPSSARVAGGGHVSRLTDAPSPWGGRGAGRPFIRSRALPQRSRRRATARRSSTCDVATAAAGPGRAGRGGAGDGGCSAASVVTRMSPSATERMTPPRAHSGAAFAGCRRRACYRKSSGAARRGSGVASPRAGRGVAARRRTRGARPCDDPARRGSGSGSGGRSWPLCNRRRPASSESCRRRRGLIGVVFSGRPRVTCGGVTSESGGGLVSRQSSPESSPVRPAVRGDLPVSDRTRPATHGTSQPQTPHRSTEPVGPATDRCPCQQLSQRGASRGSRRAALGRRMHERLARRSDRRPPRPTVDLSAGHRWASRRGHERRSVYQTLTT